MYRILIIEDDRTIANVLAENLRTWDYEVHCVTNFKNVMEDFREYEPQLVLLDIVLPLFNGFHWCQEIRKISKVPITFLSSANDNMNIVMAMNMGGDEFIEKPFDLNVVTAKVQAVLIPWNGRCHGVERCDPESGRCDSSVSGPETGTEQERIQDSADTSGKYREDRKP